MHMQCIIAFLAPASICGPCSLLVGLARFFTFLVDALVVVAISIEDEEFTKHCISYAYALLIHCMCNAHALHAVWGE